ncbi:MAG: tRNA-dihydrouridine synthase family protein [Nanoarchaeota archaeon]
MNFKNKLILAPLAGVNNIAFRKLCTDLGADIVYSQMIDSRAFIMGNDKLADFYDEKNVIAQFLGNDPEIITKCARLLESKVQAIDLNLGCPASDVVKNKCGSYLMKYPGLIKKIVGSLTKNIKIPITVKIRTGYDKEHLNAVEIARLCEQQGISAITIHGRARTVNYQTPVDYSIIKKVKEAIDIPVIGNGDIFSANDADKMYKETGVDSIMIGRGAIGNPSIFAQISGKRSPSNTTQFRKFIRYCKKYSVHFQTVKNHAQWFTKGIIHGGVYRKQMNIAKSLEDLEEIYKEIDSFL